MQTEWHNYKSGKTGRIVGSYGYAPDLSEDGLVHVYESHGQFIAYYHVKALHPMSGPLRGAQSLAQAKTLAMKVINEHVKGQGSLKLHPYL
jgi:hypothetical protein